MKVLVDTNVIIDVLTKREVHFEHSAAFLKLCPSQVTGLIAASQTTDIFYLLCRSGKSESEAMEIVRTLTDNLKVVDVTSADVKAALDSTLPDYEDGLLAFNAKRHKADYIITRNEKDFVNSPVPFLSPADFMAKFFP